MTTTTDPVFAQRPQPGEYLDYFETYISLVGDGLIFDILAEQPQRLRQTLDGASPGDLKTLHSPYTWTIPQVVGHCLDTERVFGYRAACFAAGDQTSLPGFDQDAWVAKTNYQDCDLAALVDEFTDLRRSNLAMLKRQTAESWMRAGIADGKQLSVRAAAYIMAGHVIYHRQIVEKRLA